ncbi:hypothetical protein E2562_018142, partial [Oryza meyeriana var. granulata]
MVMDLDEPFDAKAAAEKGEAALRRLRDADPAFYLSPSADLTAAAQEASKHLYSSLVPFSLAQPPPLSNLLAGPAFDAKQICWKTSMMTKKKMMQVEALDDPPQPRAVRCKRSPLPDAHAYTTAAATAKGGDAGSVVVERKRLAVFVSGGGSNFRAIHEAALGGEVNADVVALVTDKPGCGGAEHARGNGIPVIVFPKSKSAPEGVSTDELLISLRKLRVDFILLAGYLKLIPVELVQAYPKSILNIHPSLLPAYGGKGYYGLKVHKAVIASGA